jgi:hypothetical protein
MNREASEHIRTMNDRITQQAAEIVRLRLYGKDASAAIRRLELLRRALIQMRLQLETLSSTEQDAKRSSTAMAIKMLSNVSKPRS